MRSHVKASSAGSTRRQAKGHGRVLRGAAAARGGSPRATGSGASSFGLAVLGLLTLFLLLSPAAGAATVTQRPLLFTINGANAPDYPMNGGKKAAVDNATGALYVSEGNGVGGVGRIFRFHADGTPWPFSSTGLPYLSPSGPAKLIGASLAVDNSGGANQSRLYVAADFGKLYAFDPSGQPLWNLNLPNAASDVAVDLTGHPYVSPQLGYSTMVRKYDNSGSPPALIQSIPMTGAQAIDLNAADDVFLGAFTSPSNSIQKWVGGSFSSTLDGKANDVYVDQSSPSGSIFTAYEGASERQLLVVDATAGQFRLSFGGAQTPDLPYNASESQVKAALEALPTIGAGNATAGFTPSPPKAKQIDFRGLLAQTDVEQVECEDGTTPLSGGTGCSTSTLADGAASDAQEYASGGTLLGTIGSGELLDARSVAYNPTLDRLYVLQSTEGSGLPSVAAFGAEATGTVPDVTIDAPSAIGVATAHFSGAVNPQGTASEWRFQWRKAGESWATVPGSPPVSLPADSSPHTVEYTTEALRGATNYQVRLVAVNTANQLAGTSEGKVFTTTKAAQTPAVTIDEPSTVTDEGATISGTVNPREDTADWGVQTTTDPTCASGYQNQPLQSISPSSASPVNVEYTVTDLLPSQHYCARIVATNSAGSTTSEAKEFETLDAPPTQVFAAYAAPRTDTSARLNGYVNPEGSDATYRFEWSPDGSTWTALPDAQTLEVRRQITVAGELSGLQPSTTYHYRFVVENGAGPVQSDEKTFQTRSTDEMQLPERGIELVNQPNKGNQNFSTEFRGHAGLETDEMIRTDGNKVIWELFGGAPEGHTTTGVTFVSTRTSAGWSSKALAPPAEQQVGGGNFFYKLNTVTPDFHTFLMRSGLSSSTGGLEVPVFLLRITDLYSQSVLTEFTNQTIGGRYQNADMTNDGATVISANPDNGQLEAIGSEPHEIVSIMPDGTPAECHLEFDAFFGSGHSAGREWRSGYHRMAMTDGSRVYFQAYPNGGSCSNSSEHHEALYYRDRTAGETVEIDPGTAFGGSPALIRATPDGRSLFFVTATSHAGDDENAAMDVYRWDSEGGSYSCLTCVVSEAAVGLQTEVSDDFSHVYFTSMRQLVPGHGNPGEFMLYALRLSDGRLSYVASGQQLALSHDRLSSDGNVLVFTSNGLPGTMKSELTADRHAAECVRHVWGDKEVGCSETYRYEDSTNSLECLSCLPAGMTTHSVPESDIGFSMSGDGSVVAFATYERLLPQDINNSIDVYEWRNGALQLITDGETVYPSLSFTGAPRVYGVSDSGDDIFFVVIDPGLTGYEQDKLANLYDARVGGGFPRPQPPAHCSEESCQGPLVTPPAEQPTGSSGFNGAGNEVVAKKRGRCASKRGKAKRRCLHAKQRKHKKQPAKRSASQRSDRGAK